MAANEWEFAGAKDVDHEGLAQNPLQKPVGLKSLDSPNVRPRPKTIVEPVHKKCSEVICTCYGTNEDDVSECIPNPPWLRHSEVFFIYHVPRKSGQRCVEQKVLDQQLGCTHRNKWEPCSRSQNAGGIAKTRCERRLQIFDPVGR
jgi:hypothetical protein